MEDRDWQERGESGEMEGGGISPVVGDIERTTTSASTPDTVTQVLLGLTYPLGRDDLVREAAVHGAKGSLLDQFTRLPDRVYISAEDAAEELQRSH